MRAWRIFDHNAPYAGQPDFDPLAGEGGLLGDSRWHRKGRPVLYAASSPSLALLEVLVHIDPSRFREQTLLELELVENLETVSRARLQELLADTPEDDLEAATRDYGASWLIEGRSLALVAPSVVMPFESNIIINPKHPLATQVRIVNSDPISLDPRLLRKLGTRR